MDDVSYNYCTKLMYAVFVGVFFRLLVGPVMWMLQGETGNESIFHQYFLLNGYAIIMVMLSVRRSLGQLDQS